jgi:glycosyltransferase involved in cell wall biosynthesis
MKIAVIGIDEKKSGGSYHQSLKTYKILSHIKEFEFNFIKINSKKKKSNFDKSFIHYNINFLDKLFFLFYSSNILKSLLKKFLIKNRFEKLIKKMEIDLIIFLGCSRLSKFCDKIDYITYVYEFHHIFRPDLPEYRGWSDFDFREDLLKTNIKKSVALIVDTKKKAEDLIKYYNCYEKKINIIPLTPDITNLERSDLELSSKIIKEYTNTSKKYFFYPAQYWSHKNHYYILSAMQILNTKYKKKVDFVFTGFEKNNFEYLNKKTKDFDLTKQIKFFEYLKYEEIQILYKNCKALIMPSLIGYSSLPLYESFFFEKPVFYTKDLLDTSLKKFVTEIDLSDPESLALEIYNFDKNIENINEKVKGGKKYFSENLSDDKIKFEYLSLFNKINYQRKIYK